MWFTSQTENITNSSEFHPYKEKLQSCESKLEKVICLIFKPIHLFIYEKKIEPLGKLWSRFRPKWYLTGSSEILSSFFPPPFPLPLFFLFSLHISSRPRECRPSRVAGPRAAAGGPPRPVLPAAHAEDPAAAALRLADRQQDRLARTF